MKRTPLIGTVVLAGLTLLLLLLSAPGSLRDAYDRGGFYLFSRSFMEDIPKRLAGPGWFRLILQPLIAIGLGIWSGLADARSGRPPYLYGVLFHRDLRRELLKSGSATVANMVLMGIFQALRFGAVLENVVLEDDRSVDFTNTSITQNTRGAYPIEFIQNAKVPCLAGHPTDVIFLTCDAFGVLPPVSSLSPAHAMYHFISGYTAKVAGTEMGITEPQATFSPCFGGPFLVWHPTKYAELLAAKMKQHNARVWLVNTGWGGGAHGTGKRISLKHTRAIIDAIHSGALSKTKTERDAIFGFDVVTECPNVPSEMLVPRNAWADRVAVTAATQPAVKRAAGSGGPQSFGLMGVLIPSISVVLPGPARRIGRSRLSFRGRCRRASRVLSEGIGHKQLSIEASSKLCRSRRKEAWGEIETKAWRPSCLDLGFAISKRAVFSHA